MINTSPFPESDISVGDLSEAREIFFFFRIGLGKDDVLALKIRRFQPIPNMVQKWPSTEKC